MIRAIVADDSITARQLIKAILERDGDIRIIAEARDGQEAIDLVQKHRPDLVVMDVHMPRADGLQATREIMSTAPTPILVVSAVRREDVDLSLSATQAGALMALAKPEGPASEHFQESADELRRMARAMAHVKVVRRWPADVAPPREPMPSRRAAGSVELVAMAASTGGPPALRQLLAGLPRSFPVPILIVQHIARDFTAGFADWLGVSSTLPVKVATDGEPLVGGTVYVAPEGAHLGVDADHRISLDDGPPIGGFRPSATHLFASAGTVFGPGLLAVVLTGMGNDGAAGLERAHACGATVIVQDEASSVIFGMAQEAVRLGVVDAAVPLQAMPRRLVELVTEEAHAG